VEISKKIGLLFVERNTVHTSDLLDTPEFLWESDEFEPIFERMQSYLDIERRVDLLNQRLDVIRELLEMLSTQLEAQHASWLEWVVIYLIVVEVVCEVFFGTWQLVLVYQSGGIAV